MPFGSSLVLPGPENPAIGLLIGDNLCLDERLDVVVVCLPKASDCARRLLITGSNVVRTLSVLVESTVVPCTDATAIEILGAIGHGTAPLAGNGDLVRRCHLIAKVTGRMEMILDAPLQLPRAEHLIMVRIQDEVAQTSSKVVVVPRGDSCGTKWKD